jgi:hypothetical protein
MIHVQGIEEEYFVITFVTEPARDFANLKILPRGCMYSIMLGY